MFDKRLDALRRQRSRIADAKKAGMEKGIEKGIAKGIEKVARNLLAKKLPAAEIAEATGLSIDVVKKLKKSDT